MTTGDWIQVGSMCALILLTGFYAWQTWAMAKEMAKQRAEAQPLVLPDIDLYFERESYSEDMYDIALGSFPIVVANVGKAAAVDLEISLANGSNLIASRKLPLLPSGGSWKTRFSYVSDWTRDREPIFGTPPDGLYELKVTFRSATSSKRDHEFSDVTLPFELKISGARVQITRQRLQLKLTDI